MYVCMYHGRWATNGNHICCRCGTRRKKLSTKFNTPIVIRYNHPVHVLRDWLYLTKLKKQYGSSTTVSGPQNIILEPRRKGHLNTHFIAEPSGSVWHMVQLIALVRVGHTRTNIFIANLLICLKCTGISRVLFLFFEKNIYSSGPLIIWGGGGGVFGRIYILLALS